MTLDLLYRTAEVASMKKKKKKKAELDFIKNLKNACSLQERLFRNERQARDWKKNIC